MSSLANRHVVVTGASSGIGRAIAVKLASEGAKVSLFARRKAGLAATAELAAGSVPFACDVSDRTTVNAAFAQATDVHGPIHGLVAAAGIGGPNSAGENDRFDEIVATNLTGAYNCVRAAERHLADGPGARHVVLISSILGRFGVPGYTGYCASKAGLLGMTRAFALELAPKNVLVNAICPGWVDTDMAWEGIEGMAKGMGISRDEAHKMAMGAVPLGRMGTPEEIAGLVTWLLSPAAACFTGQGIDINGGAWMG